MNSNLNQIWIEFYLNNPKENGKQKWRGQSAASRWWAAGGPHLGIGERNGGGGKISGQSLLL
jgi:hypothetical protein